MYMYLIIYMMVYTFLCVDLKCIIYKSCINKCGLRPSVFVVQHDYVQSSALKRTGEANQGNDYRTGRHCENGLSADHAFLPRSIVL